MTDQLTPREHDDMRDLLVAGTQRIRPALSRRAQIGAGVAVLLIAGTVGGVATTALFTSPDVAPAGPSPTPTIRDEGESTRVPVVDATPVSPEGRLLQVPGGGEVTSLPAVLPPAPGTALILRPDPVLDDRFILGTYSRLEGMGIDVPSAQGFETVGTITPWTARLKDGNGMCILLRAGGNNGWSEVSCDAVDAQASVEREVEGVVLRFTIVGGAVEVQALSR